jgi:signal transduction histidine kinase
VRSKKFVHLPKVITRGFGSIRHLNQGPRTHPDRLVQIVTNPLSNAIKFSPSGQEVVV